MDADLIEYSAEKTPGISVFSVYLRPDFRDKVIKTRSLFFLSVSVTLWLGLHGFL
jgi:hypothetical protein